MSNSKILHFLEEATVFGLLRRYEHVSDHEIRAEGIDKPSVVISRLRRLGLPVQEIDSCYYTDRNGNRKFAARLFRVDAEHFETGAL